MVQEGNAEYIAQDGQVVKKPSSSALIYWRRPEDWADMLSQSLEAGGQRGAILTAYEIQEGDSAAGKGMVY
jgi:ESCRT-II complex subunit VPS25